jgi:hypothetical protein
MRGRSPLAAARASVFALGLGIGLLGAPELVFSAAKTSAPSAKKPFDYDTSGVVNIGSSPSSVSGPAVLQFQGVMGATFNPTVTQPINLGQFVLAPTSTTGGQTTTYNNTPFEVEVETPEFNKSNSVPVLDDIAPNLNKSLGLKTSIENSLLLKGHLDGTVTANGQVNVVATIDSIKLGSITPAGKNEVTQYSFPIRYSQFVLPPNFVLSTASPSVTVPTSTPNPIVTSLSTNATMIPATTGTVAPAPAAFSVIVANPTTPAPLPVPAPEPSTIVLFATVLGGLALGRRHLSLR